MCQGHCDVMTRRKKRTRIVNSGNGESAGILQLFRQTYVWGLVILVSFRNVCRLQHCSLYRSTIEHGRCRRLSERAALGLAAL